MSQFRYVLVDFMPIAHRARAANPLSATVMIDGQTTIVDTTIPNMTIKTIFGYGGKGRFATAVCLEGGGAARRKEYFSKLPWQDIEYKGGRKNPGGSFYEGCNLATNLMFEGGVSLYRQDGLEADDCIANLVMKIKQIDKITPIDIVTNDADLLPLVDDQVSVYMRGNRQFAQEGCPELRLHYQVTPETWDDYLSYTSAYKKYTIPYNSMLLFKMMRGDNSDGYKGAVKGYGGVTYSNLMEQMIADEVDFPTIFRYENNFDTTIKPVLENYFNEEEVQHMRDIFYGIRPFGANLQVPQQIEGGKLQKALLPVQIHLNM